MPADATPPDRTRRGRRPAPARLYLRTRAGREPQWVILDRGREIATGCGRAEHRRAESALAAHIAATWRPPAGPARLDALTVDDVIAVYLREHGPHVARPDFLAVTAAPIIRHMSGTTLDKIRAATCRAYVAARRADGVSLATARHDLATLRAAIRYYHQEHGPLPSVPAITLPETPPARTRWLTVAEAARLLAAARRQPRCGHVARLILVGLGTGTRLGAMLRLSWLPSTSDPWVDLDAGVLHRRGAAEIETAKRRPPVRLPRRLLAHMRRWHAADTAAGIRHVIHYQGRPVTKLRRSWAQVRATAGLGGDVVPHTLRHTAATWRMQAGVDRWEAAGFLGMSLDTLEQVYGHHAADWQERAAEARPRPGIAQGNGGTRRARRRRAP